MQREVEKQTPQELRRFCAERFVSRFHPRVDQLEVMRKCLEQLRKERLDHLLEGPNVWGKTTCALMFAIYCQEQLGMNVLVLSNSQHGARALSDTLRNIGWSQDLSSGPLKLRVFCGEALCCDADLVILKDYDQPLAYVPNIERQSKGSQEKLQHLSVLRLRRWHPNPFCREFSSCPACACPDITRFLPLDRHVE